MFLGVENIIDLSITATNKINSLVILRSIIPTLLNLLLMCES